MRVRDYMTTPAVTVEPKTDLAAALKRMRERRIRRLPVVNAAGGLVGIVSERDLLYASPSPATSLSVWELNYLVAKLLVEKVMTRNVITVAPNAPLEEAATLMLEHKIGGLPVVNSENELEGVITESDIFRAFIQFKEVRAAMDVFLTSHDEQWQQMAQ